MYARARLARQRKVRLDVSWPAQCRCRCPLVAVDARGRERRRGGPGLEGPDRPARDEHRERAQSGARQPTAGTTSAYEITMVNQTPGEVTVESVQARSGGRPIGARLQGESAGSPAAGQQAVGRSFRAAVARSCSWMCGTPRNAPRPKRLTAWRHHVVQRTAAARQELQLRAASQHVRWQVPCDRGRQAAEVARAGWRPTAAATPSTPTAAQPCRSTATATRCSSASQSTGSSSPRAGACSRDPSTNSRATRTSGTRSTRSPRAPVIGSRGGGRGRADTEDRGGGGEAQAAPLRGPRTDKHIGASSCRHTRLRPVLGAGVVRPACVVTSAADRRPQRCQARAGHAEHAGVARLARTGAAAPRLRRGHVQ